MEVEQRLVYLRGIDLFQSFSEDELLRFAEAVAEFSCPAGEVLFKDGEPGQDMYILLEGGLEVLKGNRAIAFIAPVNPVGEMGLIEAMPRSATVRASAASLLFKINGELFQDVAVRPSSLLSMMRALSSRIRRDTERLAADFEKANILIHDMKNSLSTFLYLDHLQRKIPGEEEQKILAAMMKTRGELAVMMEEALAIARHTSLPPGMARGSLAGLLLEMQDAEFRVHPDLQERRVTVEAGADLPEFSFNRLEIRRVIMNLVLNGAQASQPGESVSVSVRRYNDLAEVSVVDRGSGIADDVRKIILNTQVTTKQQGVGLGLLACRRIIERHGGTIVYAPAEGGAGTVFRFTLALDDAGSGGAGNGHG